MESKQILKNLSCIKVLNNANAELSFLHYQKAVSLLLNRNSLVPKQSFPSVYVRPQTTYLYLSCAVNSYSFEDLSSFSAFQK